MPPKNTDDEDKAVVLINLSPQVRKLLDDNEIHLVRALDGLGVKTTRSDLPKSRPFPEVGLKSAELVILVSAVSVPLVASGIARIIDALGRNRRVVAIATEWKPALGEDGKPIIDSAGRAAMEWRETPALLEPTQTRQEALNVEAKLLGLEFRMTGEAQQK